MGRALVTVLAIGLLAGASSGRETAVDVRALLEPARDERAPLLGTSPLRSGGRWRGWIDEDGDEDAREPLAVPEVARLLGLAGSPATALGATTLLLDAATADRARADLASLSRDLLRAVRIEVSVTHPDGSVSRGEIVARPGTWGRVVRVRAHRLVYDVDVELACDNSGGFNPSVVGDPIVGAALDGFAAEARPLLVDGGRRVSIEAQVQVGRLERVDTYQTRARYLGAIELPTYRGAALFVSGTAAPGGAIVSRFRTGEGETTVRLVPHPLGPPGTGRLRVLDAGLALLAPRDVRPADYADDGYWLQWEEAESSLVQGSVRSSRLPEDLAPGPGAEGEVPATLGSGLVAVGSPSRQDRLAAAVASRLAPLARAVRIDLDLRSAGEPAGSATLHALQGRPALLRLGVDRSMVADHDVEVGCYVQIADPIVLPVFSGLLARVVPRVAPDGETVLVELLACVQGASAPTVRPLGTVVCGSLQTVSVSRRRFDGELALSPGEPVRLDLGPDGDGRPLVLEVRAAPE